MPSSSSFAVLLLHPGFNRTGMTAKYKHIWDKEGAVEASVGAKRVLHEVLAGSIAAPSLCAVRRWHTAAHQQPPL